MATRPTVPESQLQNTQPNEPVYDALGIEVRRGDTLAIGARIGNSGELKLATVTGFGTRNESVRAHKRKHELAPGENWWDSTVNFDFAVTVQVEYLPSDPFDTKRRKGYVRAYDRKFVVVGESFA